MLPDREIRVLMVSAPLQGHLNPILKFAKCLVSKGIHVTIATNDSARRRMFSDTTAINPRTTHASTTPSIQLEFFSDGLSLDFDRDSDFDTWFDSLRTAGRKNLSDLIANLSADFKFSCVIVHQFVPWFIDVAAQHGIPCAVLWIQPCALYSIYFRYFNKLDCFPNLENPDDVVKLPGLPLLKVEDLPTLILPQSPLYFKTLLTEFFQALSQVKWVLGTSFSELEEETVKSMASVHPIHPVGPLVSPFLLGKEDCTSGLSVDMWKADDSCMRWLDKQPSRSVIYVSFGSIIVLSQKQIDNIAKGLKNSNKPFLWVFKKSTGKESGGVSRELPAGFLEEVKGKGMVVNWCSQEQVLKHEAVACFLTHCGWNSTLETVVAGVPVIAFPEWTDQPTNAKLLTDVFKVGVRMRNGVNGVVSSEEVERCIKEIADGPAAEAMTKRAVELKEAAKRAVEDGGSSHRNLDLFIADIFGKVDE